MSKEWANGKALIIELTDDAWYGPNADKDALRDSAVSSATAGGNEVVLIFVNPDPVFPLHERTKRHKVFEHNLKQASRMFETSALFIGVVNGEAYEKLGELDRRKLLSRVRDRLNNDARGTPGRYEIRVKHGQIEKVLERGRV